MYAIIIEQKDDLMHVGKGHDDNPPGRGSGRYPYGSGERPFQGEKKSLSERVGEKRLSRRLDRTALKNDRYAVKAGIKNNLMSLNMGTLNEQTRNILSDPERVRRIGSGTILRRIGSNAITTAAVTGAIFIAGTGVLEIPIVAGAALIPVGMNFIYNMKLRY